MIDIQYRQSLVFPQVAKKRMGPMYECVPLSPNQHEHYTTLLKNGRNNTDWLPIGVGQDLVPQTANIYLGFLICIQLKKKLKTIILGNYSPIINELIKKRMSAGIYRDTPNSISNHTKQRDICRYRHNIRIANVGHLIWNKKHLYSVHLALRAGAQKVLLVSVRLTKSSF